MQRREPRRHVGQSAAGPTCETQNSSISLSAGPQTSPPRRHTNGQILNDLVKINFKINDLLENYQPGKLNTLLNFSPSFKNEESFALLLHDRVLQNVEELTKLIEPKLQNWDLDRIAMIDMILMKMALCELLYFEEIPVKVSINEYIDISKIYSTQKSKDFINGVLDKVMNDLKAEGRIKKAGRGLLE